MILVVGATGRVGGGVAQQLAKAGKKVRALVRTTADKSKRSELSAAGIDVSEGDLKNRASLEVACKGVQTVISTATAIMSQQPGDSLEAVDRAGQLALVDAAKAAGVEKFIFVSFNVMALPMPLEEAKRAVEKRIQESGMAYTILRPTVFMESWLSPALGMDYANHKARVYGSGDAKFSWIAVEEVIFAAVDAVTNPKAKNRVIDLGGPQSLSLREAIGIFENQAGKKFELEEVPEAAIVAQYESATDPGAKSFAGLTATAARGADLDLSAQREIFAFAKRVSVEDYARRVLG